MNAQIQELIDRGALFVVSHSGGKDSQAMFIKLRRLVPRHQLLVIHADLPGADWPGTWDHVLRYTDGFKVVQVKAGKSLFEMARHRGMWPSPQYRQCTSDLKRDPIAKQVRHYIKEQGLSGLVVNCMDIRKEESCMRAKATPFKLSKRDSKAGREWYEWLPIHEMSTEEVFETIAEAGEEPHWAYSQGMERLSCIFCIMASERDICTAARLQPEAYQEFARLEAEIDHTFMMPRKGQPKRYLPDITGIPVELTP